MESMDGGGSRVLPASRRPDGTLRKPVRIRAGYTPQEEVAIYQPKGSEFRKGTLDVPPGYDPVEDGKKYKTKAAKKNEKRKERKHEIAAGGSCMVSRDGVPSNAESRQEHEALQLSGPDNAGQVEDVVQLMKSLNVDESGYQQDDDKHIVIKRDLEKYIRSLRKKIRTAEALQESLAGKESLNSEESEKIRKLVVWRQELQELVADYGSHE